MNINRHLFIALGLACLISYAVPPDPPAGMRWVLNETFSDEFNGTQLDDEKWYDYHPRWDGREPGLFIPENVSLSDGMLRLRGGVLEETEYRGDRVYTKSCAAVTSKSYEAWFGYYECRLKAGKSTLSTTFWLSTRATADGPEEGNDRYGLELDIQECIGETGDFDGSKMATGMNANTHFWYTDVDGDKQNLTAPADFESEDLASDEFNTYGCWWRDESKASFYFNDSAGRNVDFYSGIKEKPFDLKMAMNLVSETYPSPWITLPTDEVLLDPERNTSYYDWVRTYDLVELDAVVPAASYDIFPEFLRIDEDGSHGAGWKLLSFIYSSNQRETVHLEMLDGNGRLIYESEYILEPGLGKMDAPLLNPDVLNVAEAYLVRVSYSGSGNISDELVFSVYEEPVAPAIDRVFVWSEDFEGAAIGAAAGINDVLVDTSIRNANGLTSEVVAAPDEFTSASGNALVVSTTDSSWSAIRSQGGIDLSSYTFGTGDFYKMSFDLYLPESLSAPVGSIRLMWADSTNPSDGSNDISAQKKDEGVWHVEYSGAFPVNTGAEDFIPSEVYPYIWMHLNGAAANEFAYVDNIHLVIEPPRMTKALTVWEEDFESASIGSVSGNNEGLAGSLIETANTLSSEVVVAPEEFTTASGQAVLLSTGADSWASVRALDAVDLSKINIQEDDCYALSFDLFVPENISADIGSVRFDWTSSGQTNRVIDSSCAVSGAGVHRVVCSGTFPIDFGNGVFCPTAVRPQIYFDQDAVSLSNFVYVDNLKFAVGPSGAMLEGFELFEHDFSLKDGLLGDDDGDGVINLLEYAFGGHPANAEDSGYRPSVRCERTENSDLFLYEYRQRKDSYNGLSYQLQTSTNLLDWADANVVVSADEESEAYDLITVSFPMTGEKLFVRVRVAHP